ncbi:MAG: diacylglycerol kinase family protein [archaeon]
MIKNPWIIINPGATGAVKTIAFFKGKKIKFSRVKSQASMSKILKNKLKKGHTNFIICGGDGTVNIFVQTYMKLPKKKRETIKVGFLPSGNGNDLVNALKMPLDIKKAYERVMKGRSKKIDIIKVNKKYFITGGTIGIVTEIAMEVDKWIADMRKIKIQKTQIEEIDTLVSTLRKLLKPKTKDHFYYLSIVKRLFIGYKGIKGLKIDDRFYSDKVFTGVAIQNQEFIGKKFFFAPKASHSDGYFDIVIIRKSKDPLSDFITLLNVVQGKHINFKTVFRLRAKKATISTKSKEPFMADGEHMLESKKFKISTVPKAVSIYY